MPPLIPHRRLLLVTTPRVQSPIPRYRHLSITPPTSPPSTSSPAPPSHVSLAPTPSVFVPRSSFTVPGTIITSYFLGHHKVALQQIKELASTIELVIECRDYRVPLSSRNPLFEDALQGKEKLVVYTKRDLAQEVLDDKTRTIIQKWHYPHKVFFLDTGDRKDIRRIIDHAQEHALAHPSLTGTRLLITGIPNVGKSTLLNSLRRHGLHNPTKVARTGAQPGITRKLSSTIKISSSPLIYIRDTPGVFVPYLPNPLTMLKLTLVGCVKESLLPPITLADFLLYHVNRHDPATYAAFSEPTDDVVTWLSNVARKTGKLHKGGIPDLDTTAGWLVGRYRKGLLGRFMLDKVEDGGLEKWVEGDGRIAESVTAARRRLRNEKGEARRKKREKRM